MRPHLLEFTAFGPFSESEHVDFDELADAGLFLLHGDTGAGKSTLLDAISFALYGSVPGTRGKSPRLRSDHAAPSLSPEVRLEFSVGERRWRVTRTPSWRRPKQRGTGTTEAKASVLLERWADGRWDAVSTRFDEVGEEIKNAVGMTAEQFCQVVLLPQGGFAQFLQAGIDERADLLQRLFGTERFERVEGWLKRRAQDLGEQLRSEQQNIHDLKAQIRQVAGPDVEPEREIDAPYARALLGRAQVGEERARFAADAAHADWGQRKDEHAVFITRMEKAAARREALATMDALAAEEPRIEAIALELRQAKRADALRSMLEASAQSYAELEQAVLDEDEARAALRLHAPDVADAESDQLAELARKTQQRVGSLEALRPTADELSAAIAKVHEAEPAATDHLSATEAAEVRLAELAELLSAAERDARAAQAAAIDAESQRAVVKEVTRIEQRVADLTQEDAAITALSARRDQARTVMQDARELFQQRRQMYLDGLAARLAAQLSEDAPCPVCGGMEHPVPAAPQAISVEDRDLEALETDYENARRELGEVEQELAATRERANSARADIDAAGFAELTPGAIATIVREASALLITAQSVAAGLANAEATLSMAQQERSQTQQQLVESRAAAAAACNTIAAEQARTAELRSTLEKHLGDYADFTAAIAAHTAIAAALTATQAASVELRRRRDIADRDRQAATRGARRAGFQDLVEAGAAIRKEEIVTELEDIRTCHVKALAAAQARLSDLPAEPLELPDIAATEAVLRIAMADAETVFHQRLAQQAVAEDKHNALVKLVPALDQILAGQAPQLAEYETVRGLADLAMGDGANHRRMALSSYVLAARLEEVAAAASERLLRMTNGRYTLLHADTAPDARRRWGLGLRVRDAWTGEDRETGTLSGGETFLASLALALGLADVVTAEAGGSRIDTLFVDEGFGTLDENTLEDVLTVLDGLREGGRMVGLVSHVAELRQRIPTRLEVLKTPTGSTLRRPVARAA